MMWWIHYKRYSWKLTGQSHFLIQSRGWWHHEWSSETTTTMKLLTEYKCSIVHRSTQLWIVYLALQIICWHSSTGSSACLHTILLGFCKKTLTTQNPVFFWAVWVFVILNSCYWNNILEEGGRNHSLSTFYLFLWWPSCSCNSISSRLVRSILWSIVLLCYCFWIMSPWIKS